jgi:hypothetical protein
LELAPRLNLQTRMSLHALFVPNDAIKVTSPLPVLASSPEFSKVVPFQFRQWKIGGAQSSEVEIAALLFLSQD